MCCIPGCSEALVVASSTSVKVYSGIKDNSSRCRGAEHRAATISIKRDLREADHRDA
jgi:hypothetical protein